MHDGFSLAPSVAGDKPAVVIAAPIVAEVRKKSLLFMTVTPAFFLCNGGRQTTAKQIKKADGNTPQRGNVGPIHDPLQNPVSYFLPTAITENEFGSG
jgi:hypothetical protein